MRDGRSKSGFSLIEALFASVNPIPVKAALALTGLDCGPCRLPLSPAEPDLTERLRELLDSGEEPA